MGTRAHRGGTTRRFDGMKADVGALARPPFAGITCLGTTLGPVPLSDPPALAEQTFVPMADGVRLATDVYLPHAVPRS